MKRFFTARQKKILALVSGNKCKICGEDLNKNFEGDHIHSYSKGGKTLLPNGQALCLPCNRKKGNKTR